MKTVLVLSSSDSDIAVEWQMSTSDDDLRFFFLTSNEVSLSSSKTLLKAIDAYNANMIVNILHYDTRNEEKFPWVSFAKSIREAAEKRDIDLIHLSSDKVLGSSQIMISENESLIENEYSFAEKIMHEYSKALILRIPDIMLSNGQHELLEKLFLIAQKNSNIECIVDSAISVVTPLETCIALGKIVHNFYPGIFHFACTGMCTEYSIAEEIFRMSSLAVKVSGVSKEKRKDTKDFPEMRILDTLKFQQTYKYIPSHWKWALVSVISKRKKFPVKVGDKVVLNGETGIIVSLDWDQQTVWVADIDTLEIVIELKFDELTQL